MFHIRSTSRRCASTVFNWVAFDEAPIEWLADRKEARLHHILILCSTVLICVGFLCAWTFHLHQVADSDRLLDKYKIWNSVD